MKWNQVPRHIVGGAVLALCFAIVGALFLLELPGGNREIALVVLGLVLGWGDRVVGFHFGTSEGSSRKTDLLSREGDRSA